MHNILIVDDEPGIRQSLKGVLEDEGYKASVAESGEACIESLRKRPFDVVLLDVKGPLAQALDRKSTRLNSSHDQISYAVFCLKKKKKNKTNKSNTFHNDN